MDNPFVKEKVKVANIIVANYANRVSGKIECETDMLIDVCKNMYHDIADCFGYSIADEDFYGKYGFELNIMREIRQDVELFKKKYQDRTIVRRAIQMAQPPEVVIKTCGQNYIGDVSNRFENDCEKKLMDVVNAYAKEHSNEYSEWLQLVTERSKLPMIGQIGRDYLAGNMTYGCKRDKYPQLRDEEYWLMDAWRSGDGWAAFTQACLCYYGGVRWKEAVECYDKARELLKIDKMESIYGDTC